MTNDENGGENRPRGLLTDADRSFLRHPEDYSRQGSHARKNAILKRTRHAILDFTLLWEEWVDEEDWHEDQRWRLRGRDRIPGYDEPIEEQALEDGVRDMVAFGLSLTRADPLFEQLHEAEDADMRYSKTPYVEQFLLIMFRRLGRQYRTYVRDYDLSIEGEELMWERLRQELEGGEDVPIEHLIWALDLDALDVDPEPIQEAVQEEFRKQLSGTASDNGDETKTSEE